MFPGSGSGRAAQRAGCITTWPSGRRRTAPAGWIPTRCGGFVQGVGGHWGARVRGGRRLSPAGVAGVGEQGKPRRVAGFALADHLRTELVADALADAVAARDPRPGVVFRSGRGCPPPRGSLPSPGTARSSRRREQGPVLGQRRGGELFASLKGELIGTRPWATRAAACRAIVEYVAWYNGTGLHSTLGYLSPRRIRKRPPPRGRASSLI